MMTAEVYFQIINISALIPWALLIALPRHRLTNNLVRSGLFPAAFALAYTVMLFISFSTPLEGVSFFSLEGIKNLFSKDFVLLAGWLHYLTFDLLAGISVDRKFESRHCTMRVLCLILTLFVGPVGWLLAHVLTLRNPASVSA